LQWEHFQVEFSRKSNTFPVNYFYFENRAVWEIITKIAAEPGRPYMIEQYMVQKHCNFHAEYLRQKLNNLAFGSMKL
jgi:hypothetical protein